MKYKKYKTYIIKNKNGIKTGIEIFEDGSINLFAEVFTITHPMLGYKKRWHRCDDFHLSKEEADKILNILKKKRK